MRGVPRAGAIALALLLVALFVATWRLSRPNFDERLEGDPLDSLVIAAPEVALTLARLESAEERRVVLVTSSGAQGLAAVDLHAAFDRSFADAVEAFEALGYEALRQAARGPATLRVSMDQLTLPLDASDRHVAAGTNFRAHAEEVGREDGPFLFPKLAGPTPWNASVPDRGRLDYEAEICAVTLTAHTALHAARLGYLLCNDFTDRWMLVREIDAGGPMGPTGFADGKGGDGMLPVGALLVIPREAERFYRDLELELWVNSDLRQRARAGRMIWSPAELAARALESCAAAYTHRKGTVALTDCDGIPARTLLLTGTPAGVMFHPLTLWSARAYLRPGDAVITRATHLGLLRNRIR